MYKIKVKKTEFKLNGTIIEKGAKLKFQAVNQKNEEVNSEDIKGIKVISVFPDINTSICDKQTVKMAEYAVKYPKIKFISITKDSVDIINKWCAAKDIENIEIWSDVNDDFGIKTNSLIPKINKLNRGLLVIDENQEIIKAAWNYELTDQPDYSILDDVVA